MAFSLVVAPTVVFIHVIKKSDHVVTNFYDRVMSESLLSGNVYRSLLRFAFCSKINPRYVTEKNYRWWIRFWTLKNLQQLCCRLWLSAPRDVCHHLNTFLNHVNKTNGAWSGLKKKPSEQRSGINIKLSWTWFTWSRQSTASYVLFYMYQENVSPCVFIFCVTFHFSSIETS